MKEAKKISLYQKIKETIFDYLAIETDTNVKISRLVSVFILSLIVVNVVAIILDTVPHISARYAGLFRGIEVFSIVFFTLEYVMRLWTITVNEKFKHPLFGRIKYIFTPLALIDFFAIFPFYAPLLIPYDLRILRALRLFRIFRLFKVTQYSTSMGIIGDVFREKKRQLIISLLFAFILVIIASSTMYFAEQEAQPEVFSSIPSTMWWGISVFTTAYGDVYPVTTLGRIIGSLIALIGVGLVALPTGILASGFTEAMEKRHKKEEEKRKICPHCGKDITQKKSL